VGPQFVDERPRRGIDESGHRTGLPELDDLVADRLTGTRLSRWESCVLEAIRLHRESYILGGVVVRVDVLEERFNDFPEQQRGRRVFECDPPLALVSPDSVLEMRSSEVGMILVLVPTGVKARVRVGVVDTEPIVWVLSIPRDRQFRRIRACRGVEPGWIERRSQLRDLDLVRDELDCRNLWDTVEDVSLQLCIEVRVRITPRMWNGHPLVGRGWLCLRREKVPFADGKADDLESPLQMLPLAGNLTTAVFLVGVEGLVSERPAKLVR
jgi:hypothetical protein